MTKAKSPPMTVERALRDNFSEKFIELMRNRVATSTFKYGPAKDNFPHKVNALANVDLRIKEYIRTKNTEFLVDAANYIMFEFMWPSLPDAQFKATDSEASPGVILTNGKKVRNLTE